MFINKYFTVLDMIYCTTDTKDTPASV